MAREEKNNVINRDMNKDEKSEALDAALIQVERAYGEGSIIKLGGSRVSTNIETAPTGFISLDITLGLGGVPKGRIVEIYGFESSDKTTVALYMVAEVQKRGDIADFTDAEHTLDSVYAGNIGVDMDDLYISQPDNGEQALEIIETMVRPGIVDIVTMDSVATPVSKAEIDSEMGDSHVGLQVRLMSQALRGLTAIISRSNCIVILISQLREKVGVIFGDLETITSGRALKFYASVRLDVRGIKTLKQGGEVMGNRVRIRVMRDKIALPFKEAKLDTVFGKGISKEGDILDPAVKENIIKRSGTWFAYNGAETDQGRKNFKQYLFGNPVTYTGMKAKVRAEYELPGVEEAMEAAEAFKTAIRQTETETGRSAADALGLV